MTLSFNSESICCLKRVKRFALTNCQSNQTNDSNASMAIISMFCSYSYPNHMKMQVSAGIRNAFRQGID
ncbi:hypothetical protein CPS_4144 [Colwellia psychrerythraea 34H]|uniref:Uncharacterized protein n=1 Tax=Colwellia psychrerythraea (strain 34H / ATCC BAA-681) TaxID=167879 RepID=Q47WM4_COLP3|nr:hypothetical protein CPS_4144 [Colwellia psychrerythraea 34H]